MQDLALLKLLSFTSCQDGSAKSIVFCQWESLLRNIAAAFKAFGIRYARLQGSVYARTRTLANFKASDSEVDVLLLSLEQSASGTNLTCVLAVPAASSRQLKLFKADVELRRQPRDPGAPNELLEPGGVCRF